MFKKTLLLGCILGITLVPLTGLAEQGNSGRGNENRDRIKELRGDIKEVRGERKDSLRDLRENRASTTDFKGERRSIINTTKIKVNDLKRDIKVLKKENRLSFYAQQVSRMINARIRNLQNIITRLEGPKGIIAKMDTAGKNTTAIKAKLGEAKTALTGAQASAASALARAQEIASSTAVTSTTTLAAKNKEIRALYKTALDGIKTAHGKIQEAMKLIKETKGIRNIDTATTTATTTPTTTPTATPSTSPTATPTQ